MRIVESIKIKTIMKKNLWLAAIICTIIPCCTSCSKNSINNTPVVVENMDRFLGRWYEIARYDHKFERGQDNVSTFYEKNDDGNITVNNMGWKKGKQKSVSGEAKMTKTSGLLRVSFFWPFYSDYRILMLAKDYSYALIGGSSEKYLWFLSRTPKISQTVKEKVLREATSRGYSTSKLIWVDQRRNIERMAKM